jgi:hypothetical protein
MDTRSEINEGAGPPFVSTGYLPPSGLVRTLVAEAYKRFSSNTENENSRVYPALARVPGDLFGLCVVGTSGNVYTAGEGGRVLDHGRGENGRFWHRERVSKTSVFVTAGGRRIPILRRTLLVSASRRTCISRAPRRLSACLARPR